MSAVSFPLTVVFHSDWGVTTGTGIAGGVDSVVEIDERDLPVVRGTVLAGVIREQARLVASALDGGADGPWGAFVEALFGAEEKKKEEKGERKRNRARLVTFSDARIRDKVSRGEAVHEVVSLSIDERTGTAKDDHLRFFERARPCTLTGSVELIDTDPHGLTVPWTGDQVRAAGLVLTLSALLVRGIGSNRSDGDGLCSVLVGEAGQCEDLTAERPDPAGVTAKARRWCREQLEQEWARQAPSLPVPVEQPCSARLSSTREVGREASLLQADLEIALETPVISYEVPFSNEVRSLNFLRGTALLPLVHRRLRAAFPSNELVRDAVVTGDLLVSDALAVVGGVQGLPVPFVLSVPKNRPTAPAPEPEDGQESGGEQEDGQESGGEQEDGQASGGRRAREAREPSTVTNRLLADEPQEVHTPLRSGYVFPGLVPQDCPGVDGARGAPALIGRQSTAHDPATGAAATGQLFLVRALPAGLRMRATVTMSRRLHNAVAGRLGELFPEGGRREYVGSRRLSGTYGRATCTLGAFTEAAPVAPGWDSQGATTLWFTSDVVVRSAALGPGGGVEDLLRALAREGAAVDPLKSSELEPSTTGGRFVAGVRHRRVDSWAAADQQPRASRIAISAGSVLRVRPMKRADPDAVMAALMRLSITGVGELTAQGFGRLVVGHELLNRKEFTLASLHRKDFLPTQDHAEMQQVER